MNKSTWWVIALALAIAFSLLYKNSENQPIIMEIVKMVRPATPAVEAPTSGDIATGDVASGVIADAAAVVESGTAAVEAVVASGAEVAADAANAVVDGAADTANAVVDAAAEVVAPTDDAAAQ